MGSSFLTVRKTNNAAKIGYFNILSFYQFKYLIYGCWNFLILEFNKSKTMLYYIGLIFIVYPRNPKIPKIQNQKIHKSNNQITKCKGGVKVNVGNC